MNQEAVFAQYAQMLETHVAVVKDRLQMIQDIAQSITHVLQGVTSGRDAAGFPVDAPVIGAAYQRRLSEQDTSAIAAALPLPRRVDECLTVAYAGWRWSVAALPHVQPGDTVYCRRDSTRPTTVWVKSVMCHEVEAVCIGRVVVPRPTAKELEAFHASRNPLGPSDAEPPNAGASARCAQETAQPVDWPGPPDRPTAEPAHKSHTSATGAQTSETHFAEHLAVLEAAAALVLAAVASVRQQGV